MKPNTLLHLRLVLLGFAMFIYGRIGSKDGIFCIKGKVLDIYRSTQPTFLITSTACFVGFRYVYLWSYRVERWDFLYKGESS